MKKSTYNSRFVLTGVAAAVLVAASGSSMAADVTNTSAKYVIDVPQIINVSDSGGVEVATGANAESAIQKVTWTVKSNNAISIAFAGSHKTGDTGTVVQTPTFHKAVQDSVGGDTGEYDTLTTRFAVQVTGAEETNGFETPDNEGTDGIHDWGKIADPEKTPDNLVTAADSPDATYGRIMPNDGDGTIQVVLYATGEDKETGDYAKQSGDYRIDVKLTVTGEEQKDEQ